MANIAPALWHIGLTVSDFERSLAFYRDIMGFQPTSPPAPHQSESFDRLTETPGSKVIGVFMRMGPTILQLIQYTTAAGEKQTLRHNNAGTPHMSFFVDDVAQARVEMERRGVNIISGMVDHAATPMRSFYITDPDGLPIELVQRLPGFVGS